MRSRTDESLGGDAKAVEEALAKANVSVSYIAPRSAQAACRGGPADLSTSVRQRPSRWCGCSGAGAGGDRRRAGVASSTCPRLGSVGGRRRFDAVARPPVGPAVGVVGEPASSRRRPISGALYEHPACRRPGRVSPAAGHAARRSGPGRRPASAAAGRGGRPGTGRGGAGAGGPGAPGRSGGRRCRRVTTPGCICWSLNHQPFGV